MNIGAYLRDHDITYESYVHAPVRTCTDAALHCGHVPGLACKNMFLSARGGGYVLVIVPAHTRIDLRAVATHLHTKRLSFAGPDELRDVLGCAPGAVSPFGLLNDPEGRVAVLVDTVVVNADTVSFHPNDSTVSWVLTRDMWARYLKSLPHTIHVHTL